VSLLIALLTLKFVILCTVVPTLLQTNVIVFGITMVVYPRSCKQGYFFVLPESSCMSIMWYWYSFMQEVMSPSDHNSPGTTFSTVVRTYCLTFLDFHQTSLHTLYASHKWDIFSWVPRSNSNSTGRHSLVWDMLLAAARLPVQQLGYTKCTSSGFCSQIWFWERATWKVQPIKVKLPTIKFHHHCQMVL
jgi:hypothetical protein